jgi:hypothetical protein
MSRPTRKGPDRRRTPDLETLTSEELEELVVAAPGTVHLPGHEPFHASPLDGYNARRVLKARGFEYYA